MYLGKDRHNRLVALVLAAVLVAGVVLALLATVATAAPSPAAGASSVPRHGRLVSVSPSDGERLDRAPARIVLTFGEPAAAELAQVALTGERGAVDLSPVTAAGPTLTATIRSQLAPGGYRISWRVTSDDGHPVSGDSGFTVVDGAGRGGSVATPLVTPTYKTPQTQATTLGHPDHLPGLLVGGGLLLAGAGLLVHEQRRRRSHGRKGIS